LAVAGADGAADVGKQDPDAGWVERVIIRCPGISGTAAATAVEAEEAL
jgi:hypothetical protein